jgi:hypothetical protein
MTHMLDHERFETYRASLAFITQLEPISRKVPNLLSMPDRLDRNSMSIRLVHRLLLTRRSYRPAGKGMSQDAQARGLQSQRHGLGNTLLALAVASLLTSTPPAQAEQSLKVRLSWGHQSPAARPFYIGLSTSNVILTGISPESLEAGDVLQGGVCMTRAGAGDVDALRAGVSWTELTKPARKPHEIWAYLLEHGTPGQAARLKDDPGLTPDAPVLTVLMAPDSTRGFSIGLEQLARHKAMWLPAHDVFITLADAPVSFADHIASLRGERVLNRVKREPEATLAEWTSKWEDIGNPLQWNQPWETSWLGARGHLVGSAARHGSLYKFGVDRWANVRPDHASPHKFRLDLNWLGCKWSGQHIVNGLPVIITSLERDGQRCEIEQLAAPLHDNPPANRGEIPSVFFTQIRMTGTGAVSLGFRLATEYTNRHPELDGTPGRYSVTDRETGSVWLLIEPDSNFTMQTKTPVRDDKDPRAEFDCLSVLTPGQTNTILLKLASPAVPAQSAGRLAALDFARSRAAAVKHWEDWLAKGAVFEVPERAVNDLFRANLWHALMLPRFRQSDRIDLPYSNFAYGQLNAEWPINQAVYVDYMLYGLRGYFAVAEAELAAIYRSQQKPDGRISGYADWGVYSPAMLYAVGQNFLLSRDRASFERLLPASLKALDWCLGEVARGQTNLAVPGLIVAPLNDLTCDARAWAFPNAYFVAGLKLFGRALAAGGYPRAGKVQAVAAKMQADVERAFTRASVASPVVPLADGTWNNYVPCDAMTPRRLLDLWYPTDVDTGPLHLARLSVIEPRGWVATAMLHDHEDNLFLNQWGMANEPVYNQQATAYLRRDEPQAAIRAFYSMMACAFSHHQFSPLEHRWAWPQYYCPPSTDGAWFELYRNMLLNELLEDGRSLLIGQAVPRAWLADGRRILVTRAPTYFGPVNLRIESAAAAGRITANVQFLNSQRPSTLLVRLRHPEKRAIRSVTVNDVVWNDFDVAKEWVRISSPPESYYTIDARY